MSKTFTSRPAVTNGRGRGRGVQPNPRPVNNVDVAARPRVPGTGRSSVGASGGRGTAIQTVGATRTTQTNRTTTAQNAEPELEQRISYQGGYSMITPNQKKRQEVTQMAQKETEAYENHKQQNTQKSLNYVGTAGGGQLTETEVRMKQASPSKTQRLLKQEEKKFTQKSKVERDLQLKKEEQRRKAVQNEDRHNSEEYAADVRWDNQRRRTNEAFLKRLEKQTKQKTGATTSSVTQTAGRSESPEGLEVERPEPVGATASRDPYAGVSNSRNSPTYTQSSSELLPEEKQRLDALAAIFPQYSESELLELLRQVGFSVDAAINLLQE